MKKVFVRLGLVLLFFSCAALAFGSEVADMAKKERERRHKISTPAKVFTNKDIADFKAKNKDSDTSSDEAVSSEESSSDEGEASTEDYGTPGDNSRDENYWRNRFKEATNNVGTLQAKADQLQKTINGLLLNVSNYEATAAGPQLNAQLGDMKNQLEQVNNELSTAKKALDDLQDEARKAGADPGWVRE